jgi:hypothetical protein
MARNYGGRRLTPGLTLSSFSEEIACLISKLGDVMGYSDEFLLELFTRKRGMEGKYQKKEEYSPLLLHP